LLFEILRPVEKEEDLIGMVTLDIFVPLPVEPTEAPLDLRPVLPLLKVRCKEPVSPESDSRFLYGNLSAEVSDPESPFTM